MARFTSPDANGAPGPTGPTGPAGADGADGTDALWNFLGEWENGIDYAAGSVVQFQGSSYYHPDGQFSSYSPPGYGWLLVSAKGDSGADGADGSNGSNGADGSPGLVYLGNYISGNGYLANVAVVKGSDNNLYIATSSGGLGDPVGNGAEWSIFLPKGEDGAQGPQGEPGISGAAAVLSHEVKAGEALTKGQAVYVSSADGTNMIVSKASNASEATSSKAIGLITTDLSHNGQGSVITEGLLAGLNTNGATAGDPVWLGTGGNLIFGLTNKPIAPAHLVFIGIVTRANANNGEIFVKPQNGFELNEIHNVLIGSNYSSTPTDNDILAYDTASGLWKNQTLSNLAGLTYDGTDLSVSGKLSLTASSGNEGGEIFLNKPATNTSIEGGVTIDVYQNRLRIFQQGGDSKGAYIDMTKLPSGVAGELAFKSSAFVNAGYDVTLGNLKARIPASGNRSLQLSTVTGTYSVYGSDVHSQNGISGGTIPAGSAVTVTTTPTYINAGYHFATAGATQTWLLMDTGNGIAWRITVIIGASYNDNFISIERL